MTAERAWTILDLLNEATGFLQKSGIESPRVNAEVLLGHALGLRRLELYTRFDQPVDPARLAAFRELVRRRLARVPLQYITCVVEFYSRTFAMREGVFIPRPETEVLVERALETLRDFSGDREAKDGSPLVSDGQAPARIAEIGVGSGAVLVTILLELPAAIGVGTDVSAAALALARENAERHGVADRARLLEGNLFEPLATLEPAGPPETIAAHAGHREDRFDLLVVNPPYLSEAILTTLAPEVREHEPRAALVAGPDGFEALRPLVADAWRFLRPDGVLALEIGETQGGEALALVAGHGAYRDATLWKDYAGKDRVIVARRGGDRGWTPS